MTTQTTADSPHFTLRWLDAATARGHSATPGRRGLTLDEINQGVYGVIPESSDNGSARPRGAARRADTPRTGLHWSERNEVWASTIGMLYEEAVARQWSSATDIPWQELTPLPDDIERAMCQLCTFLTQVEFIAGDLPGRWIRYISPDHFEVGLFLATQIMDEARHEDVFRKRALANGCGLLQAGVGAVGLLQIQDFTEMAALLHVVAEGFVQSLFRVGELIGQNEAEKRMFRLAAQDESRHVAFGVTHLKYAVETQPERREEFHHYLDRQEGLLGTTQAGLTTGGASAEALAVLLGGGADKMDEGFRRLLAIRKRQVNEYVHRLEVCGLGDRRQRINPDLALFLDPARN